MPLRPYYLRILGFTAVFFFWEFCVQAQPAADFSAWKDPKNAEAVHEMSRRMLSRTRDLTGTAREEMLAQNLSALAEIAADPSIVPSTRFNAILAIGRLEASSGNPHAGYPHALTYLIDVYQQADCPPYLRYGALLGIVQHALGEIDPSQRGKMIDLFLETVASEFGEGHADPIEPDIWNWFRQTALDGLAALKTTGTEGNIAAELLLVINRKSQELGELCNRQDVLTRDVWKQMLLAIELASKAAKTLGDLDYSSATDINTEIMTDSFMRLIKVVCGIKYKIAADFLEQEKTSPEPAILLEQIVVNVKMCTQSIVWGVRSGFLTSRPGENSFYASLQREEPAIQRLDALITEIIELSAFFDEGARTSRTIAVPGMPKEFKFDLLELRNALKKCSEALY